MVAKKGHNIANGIISIFVLACGISFCVLIACLTKTLNHPERHGRDHHERRHTDYDYDSGEQKRGVSDFNDNDDDTGRYYHHHYYYGSSWTFGFAFIITGLTGIISALARKRGGYITHMVFGIITLIVKGALFVFSIYAFQVLASSRADSEDCVTVKDKCECSSLPTYNDTCEHVNRMYSMIIAILSVVVIGWILTLVTTILAGILGCKQEPATVVRHPMTTTVVHVPSHMHPQKGYLPQTHDNAKLVSNMEYEPGLYGK